MSLPPRFDTRGESWPSMPYTLQAGRGMLSLGQPPSGKVLAKFHILMLYLLSLDM